MTKRITFEQIIFIENIIIDSALGFEMQLLFLTVLALYANWEYGVFMIYGKYIKSMHSNRINHRTMI